jgi:hypothetical protein
MGELGELDTPEEPGKSDEVGARADPPGSPGSCLLPLDSLAIERQRIQQGGLERKGKDRTPGAICSCPAAAEALY